MMEKKLFAVSAVLLLAAVFLSGCSGTIGETAQQACAHANGQWVINEEFPGGHCVRPDEVPSIPMPQEPGAGDNPGIPAFPSE